MTYISSETYNALAEALERRKQLLKCIGFTLQDFLMRHLRISYSSYCCAMD